MEINRIYNEDCLLAMKHMDNNSCDVILTSPPYNMTSRKGGYADTGRYDVYVDWKTTEEYIQWSVDIFNNFNDILKTNGVILYNLSYSIETPILPYQVMCEIHKKTSFTVVDTIGWKKSCGLPFPANRRRLSRVFEPIFVLVRKTETNTFTTNRKVKSVSEKTGQSYYEVAYNFVEAANNDIKCKLNQATYSTDLCKKLLNIYCPENGLVYDPFMGVGTTALACKDTNRNYIGSEISEKQCELAKERLNIINK